MFAIFLTKNKTELANPYEAVIKHLKTNTFLLSLAASWLWPLQQRKTVSLRHQPFVFPCLNIYSLYRFRITFKLNCRKATRFFPINQLTNKPINYPFALAPAIYRWLSLVYIRGRTQIHPSFSAMILFSGGIAVEIKKSFPARTHMAASRT